MLMATLMVIPFGTEEESRCDTLDDTVPWRPSRFQSVATFQDMATR